MPQPDRSGGGAERWNHAIRLEASRERQDQAEQECRAEEEDNKKRQAEARERARERRRIDEMSDETTLADVLRKSLRRSREDMEEAHATAENEQHKRSRSDSSAGAGSAGGGGGEARKDDDGDVQMMGALMEEINAMREELQADVAEVYSPPRITREARNMGLQAGFALDLQVKR